MSWEHYLNEKEKEASPLAVAKELIEEMKLNGKSRLRHKVYNRQYLMYFLTKKTDLTLSKIGKLFKRDHATVIHALRRVEDALYIKDKEFFRMVSDLKKYTDSFEFDDYSEVCNGDGLRRVYSYIDPLDHKHLKELASDSDDTISAYLRRIIEEEIRKSLQH